MSTNEDQLRRMYSLANAMIHSERDNFSDSTMIDFWDERVLPCYDNHNSDVGSFQCIRFEVEPARWKSFWDSRKQQMSWFRECVIWDLEKWIFNQGSTFPQTLHQKANTELAVFLLYDSEVTSFSFILTFLWGFTIHIFNQFHMNLYMLGQRNCIFVFVFRCTGNSWFQALTKCVSSWWFSDFQ